MTGSQDLYGDEVLRQVAAMPADRGGAGRSDSIPVRVVFKPSSSPPRDRGRLPGGQRRTDASASSPGCTRSRRPGCGSAGFRPAEAAAAPAHPVQPRSALGRDRHGLHEPQPSRPRRPRIRPHRGPGWGRPQDGVRSLGRSRGPGAHRLVDPSRLRLARRTPPRVRPLRRQHARGRSDRGRQGRGPDPARRLDQRLQRERPRRRRPGCGRGRGRSRWSRSTDRAIGLPRACSPEAPTTTPARSRPDRGRLARVPWTAGYTASPTRSRTSTASGSSPALPASA